MTDAVIVDAVRTPVGRRGGALAGIHPAELSAHVLTSLAERTGLDPAEVGDVIWGCVSQVSEQAGGGADRPAAADNRARLPVGGRRGGARAFAEKAIPAVAGAVTAPAVGFAARNGCRGDLPI